MSQPPHVWTNPVRSRSPHGGRSHAFGGAASNGTNKKATNELVADENVLRAPGGGTALQALITAAAPDHNTPAFMARRRIGLRIEGAMLVRFLCVLL